MSARGEPPGRSAETPHKHEDLAYFLAALCDVIAKIHTRYQGVFGRSVFVDLHAGDGGTDEDAGSPLLMAMAANAAGLRADIWCCEVYRPSYLRLQRVLGPWLTGDRVRVIPLLGDNRVTVPELLARYPTNGPAHFGLIHSDSNGAMLDVDLINRILHHPKLEKLDVLSYLAAAADYKRRWTYHPDRHFRSDIAAIEKRYGWVRRREVSWGQWIYLAQSNYDGLPNAKALGFISTVSPEGEALLTRLDLSKRERQPMLPFLATPPTAPMPNISGIQPIDGFEF